MYPKGLKEELEMADNPLVSIIIPCYNTENYIGEAIDSALGQTYKNIEVIVIDDGSEDGSLEIIKSYGDRIRWETGPNRGAWAARNRGIELARGEFIQFLDADDLLLPEKVEACLKSFTEDVDVVFSGRKNIGECGARKNPNHYWPGKGGSKNPLVFFVSHGIQTSQPLHRTSSLRKVGGFLEGLWNYQEYELHFRLALAGARFKKINSELVLYREHSSSSRIKKINKYYVNAIIVRNIIYEQAERAGVLDKDLRQALANQFAFFARIVYREGYPALAIKAYKTARKLTWIPCTKGRFPYDIIASILGLNRTERLYKIFIWMQNILISPFWKKTKTSNQC
jgi:glycosyltransferase involved in cell wall biosynthesis